MDKSNEYEIREMIRPQVEEIYARNLTEDFPTDERKPLSIIEMALDQGKYACYGYFAGDRPAAYAFLAKWENNVLVDYFAVERSQRGKGLGSRFLRALIDGPLKDFDCALLEVDDPDHAPDKQAVETCLKRIRFYKRNGLKETNVQGSINHVKYRVMALPVGPAPSGQDILDIYLSIYRAMPFDEELRKKVQIEGSLINDPLRAANMKQIIEKM